MNHFLGQELRLSPPDETRERIISLEDRLERAEFRRSGLPAGILLFAVIGVFMFWKEIPESIELSAGFLWIASFGVGTIVLLALNELTARRTIRGVKEELKLLRNPTPLSG